MSAVPRPPSFLNGDNNFELEGEIAKLPLPTSLASSIRLRLAGVEQQEPALYLLLQLAAVLSGSFVATHVQAVWPLLLQPPSAGDGECAPTEVEGLLARALQHKFLKLLSSSGVTTSRGQRRRSSAANTGTRYVFQVRGKPPTATANSRSARAALAFAHAAAAASCLPSKYIVETGPWRD